MSSLLFCQNLKIFFSPNFQLYFPEKVLIPERYMPDSDEEDLTEEEKAVRREKAEKIKRILTQQRCV